MRNGADFTCWIWKVCIIFFSRDSSVEQPVSSLRRPLSELCRQLSSASFRMCHKQRINTRLLMQPGHEAIPLRDRLSAGKHWMQLPVFKHAADQTRRIWHLWTALTFNQALWRRRVFGKRTSLQPVSSLSVIIKREFYLQCVFKQKRHEGHLSVQTREESRASGGSDPIKASSPTTVAPVPVSSTLLRQQCMNENETPWWNYFLWNGARNNTETIQKLKTL